MEAFYGKPSPERIPWPEDLPRLKLQRADPPKSAGILHSAISCAVFPEIVFCGDTHCVGQCGLPGLFLRLYYDPNCGLSREDARVSGAPSDSRGHYVDLKAAGPWVACGPAWQRTRWKGERTYLPQTYQIPPVAEMWWR